ncbi:MAG: serine hydrolase [Halopenitus sp.]
MSLDASTRRRIDAFVSDWLSDADVPGAGLAIVDPDGIQYATGYGARDLEAGDPATPDTLFGIGSCSKSVTALAVQQLAERGAVDLDDPVNQYVDRFDGEDVTIHELLTHTSGMPSDGMAVAQIARRTGAAPATAPSTSRDDFARLLEDTTEDRVTDRESFFYYNSGYTVLADLVEAVSGRPFREYVDAHVFTPLGMDRTTYSEAAFEADGNAATPYYRDPDDEELTAGGFPFGDRVDGPGGIVSSANELAGYVRAQLRGGDLDGDRVVGEDALETAHQAHATRQRFLDGSRQGYGYGWMRQPFGVGSAAIEDGATSDETTDDEAFDTLVGHGGSVSVATAFLGWLEDAEVGVALACNTSADPHPMHVGPAVLAIATGREPEATVPRYALDTKLDPLAGTYESVHGIMTAEVTREGGTLALDMETDLGEQSFTLVPNSLDPDDLTFHTASGAGAEVPVRFERDDDGNVRDLFVQRWRLKKDSDD